MKPGDKREIEGKIYIARPEGKNGCCNGCIFSVKYKCRFPNQCLDQECSTNDTIYKLYQESSFSEDDIKERIKSKLSETVLQDILSEIVIDILNEQKQ